MRTTRCSPLETTPTPMTMAVVSMTMARVQTRNLHDLRTRLNWNGITQISASENRHAQSERLKGDYKERKNNL